MLTAFAISAAGATSTPAKGNSPSAWVVQVQPQQLVNGSPVIFQVTPPARLTALSAKWLEHDVSFAYDSTAKAWYGIAGVSLETHPGIYALELNGTTARGIGSSFFQDLSCPAGEISKCCGNGGQALYRAQS